MEVTSPDGPVTRFSSVSCHRSQLWLAFELEASLQSRYWRSPFIEPTFNEQGARLEKSVRCAKFRQYGNA